MPISLLILVVFQDVVRRKQRELVVHKKEKSQLGGLRWRILPCLLRNALPQLVILGLRQELFCDIELSIMF